MKVRVTDHAVERFQERVRPTLDLAACRRELLRLTGACAPKPLPPAWKHHDPQIRPDSLYAELSDGVCAVLTPRGHVLTIVTRAGSGAQHRQNKNELKARRRRARKAKNRNRREGRPRIEGEAWPT